MLHPSPILLNAQRNLLYSALILIKTTAAVEGSLHTYGIDRYNDEMPDNIYVSIGLNALSFYLCPCFGLVSGCQSPFLYALSFYLCPCFGPFYLFVCTSPMQNNRSVFIIFYRCYNKVWKIYQLVDIMKDVNYLVGAVRIWVYGLWCPMVSNFKLG